MAHNFDENDRVKSNWWKKENVGDKIQGTLISKRQVQNQLSGQDQWIYEILTEGDESWNVGGNPAIDVQMRHVKLGQIVEFRFIEVRPNKKPGMNATKVIAVYQDKNVVNEKWLQEQEQANLDTAMDKTTGESSKEEPSFKDEEPKSTTESDRTTIINELAKTKLGITDESLILQAVQEKTGLAFIPTNYDTIIEKLQGM
jgi:hypothetical protein